MKDLVSASHVLLGLAVGVLPIIILFLSKKENLWLKPLSFITAGISWILLLPSGNLYLEYYPLIKPFIKAGPRPWAHAIFMETKEHWGLLLPIIATVAAGLLFSGRIRESKKWWGLTVAVSLLLAVMGRIVTLGLGGG